MPSQGRLGDKANTPSDAHGCPGCPHPGVGPAISGSANVNVNGRPALRQDDTGMHAACCGPNMWRAAQGSATVFINGKPAHRVGDATSHCGGNGKLIDGSQDVLVGGASSAGSGSGGGGGGGGDSGGGGGGGGGAAAGAANVGAASARASDAGPAGATLTASESPGPGSPAGAKSPTEFASAGRASAPLPSGPEPAPPVKPAWIEIALVDESGAPVADEDYRIELPDGSIREGRTDDEGQARIEGVDPGTCLVSFPWLDEKSWKRN